MVGSHLESWGGLPTADFQPERGLTDPELKAWRVATDFDDEDGFEKKFEQFLACPGVEKVESLVIGYWAGDDPSTDSSKVCEALLRARPKLPALRALFVGDVTYEECEISWIEHGDLSGLFIAYPELLQFGVRGGSGLSLGVIHLEKLEELVIQTGGLDVSVVRQVAMATLPALRHLELWLGGDEYVQNQAALEDIAPILADRFPSLEFLGLMNSDLADDIAEAIIRAPVLDHIHRLDLSMGTLGDRGGEALLSSPRVAKLESLNLRHHYLSDDMMAKLKALGSFVDVSEQEEEEDEDDRYVEVSE